MATIPAVDGVLTLRTRPRKEPEDLAKVPLQGRFRPPAVEVALAAVGANSRRRIAHHAAKHSPSPDLGIVVQVLGQSANL